MSTNPPQLNQRSSMVERLRMFKFRRLTLVTITVLAVVAASLGVINALQGPHLVTASVDPQALVTRSNQRLVLQTNQPLASLDASQVSVQPETAFTVLTSGTQAAVQFSSALSYGTTYQVSMRVQSTSTGLASTLSYSFSTPAVTLYTLNRQSTVDASLPDQVLRQSFDGSSTVVFDAPHIQTYAASPSGLLAVTLDSSKTPSLSYTALGSRTDTAISVPVLPTYLQSVHASDTANLFGFLLISKTSDQSYDSHLYLYSPATAQLTLIHGPSQTDLSVMDWAFVPGSSQLVVQGYDNQFYLVDPSQQSDPVVLGQHSELLGFVPGTTELAVSNGGPTSLIDLSTGTTTAVTLPTAQMDASLYPGRTVLLTDSSFAQSFTQIQLTPTFSQQTTLVRVDASGTSVLIPASPDGVIQNYCPSPNGQYLAVDVAPSSATPDKYPINSGYPNTTTTVLDLASGQTVATLNGMTPSWCR